MILRTSLMTAAVAAMALLGGCVYPDNTRGDYSSNYDSGRNSGYNDDYRGNYRQTGVVTDIDRVSTRGGSTSGGGAVLGAIIGGVLGNQIGKGDGRKAATVVGAVAGGAVGNNVGGRNDRYYSSSETRCRTVHGSSEERRIAGYDVQYRYRGDVFMSRLDYDPGEPLRIRVSVDPAD